jgi:hypothetical protein
LYDFYQTRIDECDEQIERALAIETVKEFGAHF